MIVPEIYDFCIVRPTPKVEQKQRQPSLKKPIGYYEDDSDDGKTVYDYSKLHARLAEIKDGSGSVSSTPEFDIKNIAHPHSDPEDYLENENDYVVDRAPHTQLYWNLDHCPIPQGANLIDLRRKIKIALHRLGIHGYLHVWTYGGKLSHNEDDLLIAPFLHTPSPSPQQIGWTVAGQMCVDILGPGGLATDWDIVPTVFVVIAKLSPELTRVLEYIHSKCQKTLLTIDPEAGLFESARSVYERTSFVGGGGEPKTRPPTYPARRIMPAKVLEADVFWDAMDCPFPLGWSPDNVYNRIKSYFTENHHMSGEMFVSAYVDEKESLREFPQLSQIDFIPAGYSPPARHERMFNDLLLWMIHHPVGAHLLVAGQITEEMYNLLANLGEHGCSVIIIIPTNDTPAPESHDWPGGYLLDQAYSFGLC